MATAEVVNLRRLGRACDALVSAPAPERRSVVRLREFCATLKTFIERVERHKEEAGPALDVEDDELLAARHKLRLFERYLDEHRYLLAAQHAPALGAAPAGASALDGAQASHRSQPAVAAPSPDAAAGGPTGQAGSASARGDGGADLRPLAPPPPPSDNDLISGNGSDADVDQPLVGAEGARRRRLFESSSRTFADFVKSGGTTGKGNRAMADQLKSIEQEKESIQDALSGMVGQLKDKVSSTNDKVRSGTAAIEEVEKKMEQNLSYLTTISSRLDVALSNTTFSCKSCTFGTVVVLGLWVLAYLVMRIFPKVKPVPA